MITQQTINQILTIVDNMSSVDALGTPEREEWRTELRALLVNLLAEAASSNSNVNFLKQSIVNYLDHPGCNNPARGTAMAKLRWAAEQP